MNLKESIRKILREEVKYIKPDEKVNQTLLKMVNTVFSGIEMYHKKISESTHKFTFCKDGEEIVYIVLYFDVDEDVWDDVRPTNERSFTTGRLMVPKSIINHILNFIPVRRNYLRNYIEEWFEDNYMGEIQKIMGMDGFSIDELIESTYPIEPCSPNN